MAHFHADSAIFVTRTIKAFLPGREMRFFRKRFSVFNFYARRIKVVRGSASSICAEGIFLI